jgi:hypothetical protein
MTSEYMSNSGQYIANNLEEVLSTYKDISPEKIQLESKEDFTTSKLEDEYTIWLIRGFSGSATSGISLRTHISNAFDSGQRDLIKGAVNNLALRVPAGVGYCVRDKDSPPHSDRRNPNYPFPTAVGPHDIFSPSMEEWLKLWICIWLSMGAYNKNGLGQYDYRPLFIDREDIQDTVPNSFTLGKAEIQLYHNANHLRIRLNGKYLNSTDPFSKGTDSNVWTGTIMHEILHNLGWDHPNGYPGTYITLAEECASTVSLAGFNLSY